MSFVVPKYDANEADLTDPYLASGNGGVSQGPSAPPILTRVVGTVTMTNDIDVSGSNVVVELHHGATLNMAGYRFINKVTDTIEIMGEGTIIWTGAIADMDTKPLLGLGRIFCDDVKLSLKGITGTDPVYLCGGTYQQYDRVTIAPSVAGGGVMYPAAGSPSTTTTLMMRDCVLSGENAPTTGAPMVAAIQWSGQGLIENLKIVGSFTDSAATNPLLELSALTSGVNVRGLLMAAAGQCRVNVRDAEYVREDSAAVGGLVIACYGGALRNCTTARATSHVALHYGATMECCRGDIEVLDAGYTEDKTTAPVIRACSISDLVFHNGTASVQVRDCAIDKMSAAGNYHRLVNCHLAATATAIDDSAGDGTAVTMITVGCTFLGNLTWNKVTIWYFNDCTFMGSIDTSNWVQFYNCVFQGVVTLTKANGSFSYSQFTDCVIQADAGGSITLEEGYVHINSLTIVGAGTVWDHIDISALTLIYTVPVIRKVRMLNSTQPNKQHELKVLTSLSTGKDLWVFPGVDKTILLNEVLGVTKEILFPPAAYFAHQEFQIVMGVSAGSSTLFGWRFPDLDGHFHQTDTIGTKNSVYDILSNTTHLPGSTLTVRSTGTDWRANWHGAVSLAASFA